MPSRILDDLAGYRRLKDIVADIEAVFAGMTPAQTHVWISNLVQLVGLTAPKKPDKAGPWADTAICDKEANACVEVFVHGRPGPAEVVSNFFNRGDNHVYDVLVKELAQRDVSNLEVTIVYADWTGSDDFAKVNLRVAVESIVRGMLDLRSRTQHRFTWLNMALVRQPWYVERLKAMREAKLV